MGRGMKWWKTTNAWWSGFRELGEEPYPQSPQLIYAEDGPEGATPSSRWSISLGWSSSCGVVKELWSDARRAVTCHAVERVVAPTVRHHHIEHGLDRN